MVWIEALRCSGLPETIVYDEVPQGLSATPTLSVDTESPSPATVTAQLSYLASDFDWAANYVVRLAEDGKSYDLFAWLTLANGNGESFADAQTQAVIARVQASGECFVAGANWRGKAIMRISVTNENTTEADVDRSVAAMLKAWSEVRG